MHRLPQLLQRLAELRQMRDEYRARGNRQIMASYIETLIADADAAIARIENGGPEPRD